MYTAHVPPGYIESLWSRSVEVSSSPCVWEVQPVSEPYMSIIWIAFSLALSPLSATETDLEETLGGDEDAAEGDRDDKADFSVVLVFSFLGDLVHVSVLEVGDSRSSE